MTTPANENNRVGRLVEIQVQNFITHRKATLLHIFSLLQHLGQQIVKLRLNISNGVLALSVATRRGNAECVDVLLIRQDFGDHFLNAAAQLFRFSRHSLRPFHTVAHNLNFRGQNHDLANRHLLRGNLRMEKLRVRVGRKCSNHQD